MIHFVIYGSDYDYMEYAYSDLKKCSNAEYLRKSIISNNPITKLLFKFHFSTKLNNRLSLPFKKIWFKKIAYFAKGKDNYCFIFFASRLNLVKAGYIDYLRKHYPNSKMICVYSDLVKVHNYSIGIMSVKKIFDYVYSFDQNDCEEYGLNYYPLVYSNTFSLVSNEITNDVYFLGLAKNRMAEIIETYELLKSKGLKCDFHIVGAKDDEKLYADEIDYCDGIPYNMNLEYISKSRAILEIMQRGGYGFTLRTCEAIMFDKMLITNNVMMENSPFYNANNIVLIKNINSFNWSNIKGQNIFDHKYKDKLSPIYFLQEIEKRIGSNS